MSVTMECGAKKLAPRSIMGRRTTHQMHCMRLTFEYPDGWLFSLPAFSCQGLMPATATDETSGLQGISSKLLTGCNTQDCCCLPLRQVTHKGVPLGDLQRVARGLVASCRHLHLGASTLQLCALGCNDIRHVTLKPFHTCMQEEEGVSRRISGCVCNRIRGCISYLMKLIDSRARRRYRHVSRCSQV